MNNEVKMTLNKKTLNSATGKYLIDVIEKLLSIVDAEDFIKDEELKEQVDNIIRQSNSEEHKYTLF
jgi:hypothetical protein